MKKTNSYVQFETVVIKQAWQINLLFYLQAYELSNLRRVVGKVYRTREHDSFKISNGKWLLVVKRFLRCFYLIKVKNYSFAESAQTITEQCGDQKSPLLTPKKDEKKSPAFNVETNIPFGYIDDCLIK